MERRLEHLGLIIDGNRRYAKKLGSTQIAAYEVGAKKVYEAIRYVFTNTDIHEISVYALSYDNLLRGHEEVDPILKIQKASFDSWTADPFFREKGIMVKFVGSLDTLPLDFLESCRQLENRTASNCERRLNILVAYNGHREISDAVYKAIKTKSFSSLGQNFSAMDLEKLIHENFDITRPVDLVIRTGSGNRLSGFLPWQAEYAEMFSFDKLWPEIEVSDLENAIAYYNNSETKHGL